MFSTSGYFKGLTCPYFAGGLCERPYCHFRHVKPSASEEKTGDGYTNSSDPGSASKPTLLNMVGDAIRQVQRDIEKDKARMLAPAPGPVVYNPTPLAHCSAAPPPQRENNLKRVTIPQYKPTPIRLLKKQTTQQKRAHSELEYDPATNFSTSGPVANAKTVTVADEPKEKYLKVEESDNDDIEAMFSDDDDDIIITSSEPAKKKSEINKDKKKEVDKKKDDRRSSQSKRSSSSEKSSVKVKKEPVDKSEKGKSEKSVSISKKDSPKSDKNIFDLVCVKKEKSEGAVSVKSEKCDETVTIKSEKSDADVEKPEIKIEKPSSGEKSSVKTEKSDSDVDKHDKSDIKVEKKSSSEKSSLEKSSSEKSSSHHKDSKSDSSRKRSHSSDNSKSGTKERRSSSHDKHRDEKRRSSSDSKKSDGSRKDKDKERSSDKHSSRSHHKSSSSSHKSSPRKHHNSTSSQDSGRSKSSKRHSSGDRKHKDRKERDRKESTDSRSSDKSKNLNFVSLFGGDSDNDVVVVSDNEQQPQKDVVELSSEEEVLDLEALFNDDSPEKDDEDHDMQLGEMEAPAVPKKRVAHAAASNNMATQKRCAVDLPKARPSPAEVLYNRMKEMKRRADEEAQKVQEGKVTSTSSIGSQKKRQAHSTPFTSKKSKDSPADSSTQARTVDKGSQRVAHMPCKAALVRPIIPAEKHSKVPSNVRQRYLNTFIDECMKIYPNEQDAHDRGLEEEKQVYARSGTKVVYLNNAVNTVKKLRHEAKEGTSADNLSPVPKMKTEVGYKSPKKSLSPQKPGTPSPKKQVMMSHEAILGGKKSLQSNFTIKRSGKHIPVPDKFTGPQLYKHLEPYILTEEQLFDNGFPQPDPESPGSAIINVLNDSDKIAAKANERICSRCGKRFLITEEGKCVIQEQCVHHWGKAYKRKIAGQWDHRYSCCSTDLSAKGCQIGQRHVHDQNKYDDLTGYKQTRPPSSKSDGDYGIFALDCEMVYTEGGFQLARVTVIDDTCEVALESKVMPDYPIVDYNTRFSGITEEDMVGVTTSLRDIQKILLKMFCNKTILIGHSLESDMVALKLIHETVVDTSVVFPHKLGPPYKKALRTLMADYMQRIIQNDEDGHDSKEDAVSCMDLMLWKVKEDVKKAMRRK